MSSAHPEGTWTSTMDHDRGGAAVKRGHCERGAKAKTQASEGTDRRSISNFTKIETFTSDHL